MANPIVLHPSSPCILNPAEFAFVKVKDGYDVLDDNGIFRLSKPNGQILCSCPDFRLDAPCGHVFELKARLKTGAPLEGVEPAPPAPPVKDLPFVRKTAVARALELPFRPDQIKTRDGFSYISGAAVIQRLNDVLGSGSWSFKLIGQPVVSEEETIVTGRLIARVNGQRVVKEDFGAHETVKGVVSRGDARKAAQTDCLKRCARQLGIGLHLYSPDGSLISFRPDGTGH